MVQYYIDRDFAIGIDLGVTHSYVGVFQDGYVETIADEQGNRAIPSYVAFTESERLVGEAAKRQAMTNPNNTVFDVQRFIGRQFDDVFFEKDIYPFDVVNDDGQIKISVMYKSENVEFTPEEITAALLSKMKQTAENYLCTNVTDAVITVPAYFNIYQRQATKDAATIAGLNVLRIINEPTAAAIANELDKKTEFEKNILIFYLGYRTFDVSIFSVKKFYVRATSGDAHLGGDDFDTILVDYCAEEFFKKTDKDLRDNKQALLRLRTACQEATQNLFTLAQTSIEVVSLFEGIDFKIKLSRAKFEELCNGLFTTTLKSVDKALVDARIEKEDIYKIVLVGSSTRMPKIQRMLTKYGKICHNSINPEEVIVHGAAIQAANISSYDSDEFLVDILLLDVTPLSLGIQTMGGEMTTLIPRHTIIPVLETRIFSTSTNDQTKMLIQVFAGERALTKDNFLLGQFRLYGIPKSARSVPQIEVTFDIDVNKLFTVSAIDKSSGNTSKIEIQYEIYERLANEKIDRMLNDINEHENDQKHSPNEILLIDDDIYEKNSPLSQFEDFIGSSFSKIELLLAKSSSTNIVYNLENAKNVLLNTNSNATFGDVSLIDQSNSDVATLQVSIIAIQEFMSKYVDRTDATQQTLVQTLLMDSSVNFSNLESTQQSTKQSIASVDEKMLSLKSANESVQLKNQNTFENDIQELLKVLIEKTKIINESKTTNELQNSTQISIEQNQLNFSENETEKLTEEFKMEICFEEDIIETDSQTPVTTIGKTGEIQELMLNTNIKIELIEENAKTYENKTRESEELVELKIAALKPTVSDSEIKLKTQIENKVLNVVLVSALIGLAGYYIVKRIRFI